MTVTNHRSRLRAAAPGGRPWFEKFQAPGGLRKLDKDGAFRGGTGGERRAEANDHEITKVSLQADSTCLTQQTGANCGAKTSAVRLAEASLPIRSMGHKRSPLQKGSQKFCGQPKSQPPRYQYLDWSKGYRLTA